MEGENEVQTGEEVITHSQEGATTAAPETAEVQTAWDGKFEYEGVQMQTELDPGTGAFLEEKGFNQAELAQEFYSNGLELKPETLEKLNAAFGAPVVAMALENFQSAAKQSAADFKQSQADAEKATSEAHAWGEDLVKGVGDWDKFSEAATAKMTDDEVAQFNTAMESGNRLVQGYAIQAALAKLAGPAGATDPMDNVELGDQGTADESGIMTAAQYQAELGKARAEFRGNPRGYQNAVRALDERRMASIRLGH